MATNRITELLTRQKNLLSVYYTAGYPALQDTCSIGVSLVKAGADLLEIGIPFSDPVADGPTIQLSSKTALDNGMNLPLLLEQVAELRREVSVPIILMGYLNPILQLGLERFAEKAAAAGVDGVIIPDLPMEEYRATYAAIFQQHNLRNIFLVAPTTSESRIRQIDQVSEAFIYAVSSSATTGATTGFSDTQVAYFARLQEMKLHNPILIGFGISTPGALATACQFAHGGIVGSAFIHMLAKTESNTRDRDIQEFITNLKSQL